MFLRFHAKKKSEFFLIRTEKWLQAVNCHQFDDFFSKMIFVPKRKVCWYENGGGVGGEEEREDHFYSKRAFVHCPNSLLLLLS